MIYNILAVGDVVGECGVKHLSRHLRSLKKRKSIHFTVVNGENAAMVGLTPNDADDIFAAGADVITLGNHTFGKLQIRDYLDDCPYILRPANLGSRVPGRGYAVYDCGAARIAVMNLIGRCDLSFHASNPFLMADGLLKAAERPTFTLVDFHAEATSEKLALAYYIDGRVSALWGTHTHVPTADEEVFPKGTGYLTDLGMTGAAVSVLGIARRRDPVSCRGPFFRSTARPDFASAWSASMCDRERRKRYVHRKSQGVFCAVRYRGPHPRV